MSFWRVQAISMFFKLYVHRPANDISIEFEILPKFAVPWLKIYSTDHN